MNVTDVFLSVISPSMKDLTCNFFLGGGFAHKSQTVTLISIKKLWDFWNFFNT